MPPVRVVSPDQPRKAPLTGRAGEPPAKKHNFLAQGHSAGKRMLFSGRIDHEVWALMQARQMRTKESMNAILNEFCRKGVGL